MISPFKYVVDVMTPDPVLVGPDTRVWIAECLSERRGVHDLLVVSGYHLAGIACRCDLARVGTGARVGDCMRCHPVTIDDQDTAAEARHLMERCAVGCLPVVDWSGCLRGVVTRHDLVAAGVMPASQVRTCTACGSSHGLEDVGVEAFCLRCLEGARQPRTELDHHYFTVGGGD